MVRSFIFELVDRFALGIFTFMPADQLGVSISRDLAKPPFQKILIYRERLGFDYHQLGSGCNDSAPVEP